MSRASPRLLLLALLTAGPAVAAENDELAEFFEKQVRPLLVERCSECHTGAKPKGGLRLDSRAGLLAGGDLGPAIVPGKPAESLLIEAIHYGDALQMPPKSKLSSTEIATLTHWVALGAPWPAERTGNPTSGVSSFDPVRGAQHWSLQPLRIVEPPPTRDRDWPLNPIDRFLLSRLEAVGLKPAPDCDDRVWLRRVTFDLIGLPPSPDEIDRFLEALNRQPAAAREQTVERLLASPHYGERWARHWLDLVRFAESSGHEFDFDIPDAWRYRDYVIRAFNADLPYDDFIREHIAGDLLPEPRRDPADGRNESVLGTGFFFLGEGTHSPVDLRDEEALRIDNQIDVLGKAFLGLTIACARCHDHKFDPISTRDYYALFGVLRSSRHQHAFLGPPAPIDRLEALKSELLAALPAPLPAPPPCRSVPDDHDSVLFEDFDGETYEGWFVTGDAFGRGPSGHCGHCGLRVRAEDRAIVPVESGQAHSGLVSDRLRGVLRSRTFVIERPFLHLLAAGQGGRVNVVIDGFEKIRSPIYGGLTIPVDQPAPHRWFTIDVGMWIGHRAYIELSDGATVDYTAKETNYTDGSGFLAVAEIRCSNHSQPPPLATTCCTEPIALADPAAVALFEQYRAIEAEIPPPALGLAITEGTGENAPIYVRGNTKTPGEVVPRRFLEVLGGADQPPPAGSGRLELARQIADPNNPLTARVLVNRLWKHHFGAGLVATPDDFGAMGRPPNHPELLDWLAVEFLRSGWSIKQMHRLMVLSHAYRMSSAPAADRVAEQRDPDNLLLHRMNLRRLEAEALRDAILAVSGRLDRRLFGPGVPPHLTEFMEGRGRPARSGPRDGDGRRSVYLTLRRNFLPPMLLAFDFPQPASGTGRRNVSNVPAQALTLLNDPFVIEQARFWADQARRPGVPTGAAMVTLFETALGRPPTPTERSAATAFVSTDRPDAWTDLCHVLFNMKAFLFVE